MTITGKDIVPDFQVVPISFLAGILLQLQEFTWSILILSGPVSSSESLLMLLWLDTWPAGIISRGRSVARLRNGSIKQKDRIAFVGSSIKKGYRKVAGLIKSCKDPEGSFEIFPLNVPMRSGPALYTPFFMQNFPSHMIDNLKKIFSIIFTQYKPHTAIYKKV
jgi:hypothetical protein